MIENKLEKQNEKTVLKKVPEVSVRDDKDIDITMNDNDTPKEVYISHTL